MVRVPDARSHCERAGHMAPLAEPDYMYGERQWRGDFAGHRWTFTETRDKPADVGRSVPNPD